MPKFLYLLIQFTWGLPQTLAGLILFLYYHKYKHFDYRNAIITVWSDGADCVSLGPFLFISGRFLKEQRPKNAGALSGPESKNAKALPEPEPALERILRHEYGHSVQSLMLGPLYLLLIGLPSILWCRVPRLGRRWRTGKCSYYSFFTERSADRLGGNQRE